MEENQVQLQDVICREDFKALLIMRISKTAEHREAAGQKIIEGYLKLNRRLPKNNKGEIKVFKTSPYDTLIAENTAEQAAENMIKEFLLWLDHKSSLSSAKRHYIKDFIDMTMNEWVYSMMMKQKNTESTEPVKKSRKKRTNKINKDEQMDVKLVDEPSSQESSEQQVPGSNQEQGE